jgi:hypothetical protein
MPFSIPMRRIWTSLPGMPTVRHRVIPPFFHIRGPTDFYFYFSAMRLQVLADFHQTITADRPRQRQRA